MDIVALGVKVTQTLDPDMLAKDVFVGFKSDKGASTMQYFMVR